MRRSYYANSFIGRDERACVSLAKNKLCAGAETHLALETNAFMAGDERVNGWRRKRLVMETNALYTRDELVENARSFYLAFDWYCTCIAIYMQWRSLLD